jgi:hypothetical protein
MQLADIETERQAMQEACGFLFLLLYFNPRLNTFIYQQAEKERKKQITVSISMKFLVEL